MSFMDKLVEDRRRNDPDFREGYEATVAAEQATQLLMSELIELRKKAKISQRDMAKRMGVSQPRIAQIERLRDGLSAETMIKYALAVDARIGRLSTYPTRQLMVS